MHTRVSASLSNLNICIVKGQRDSSAALKITWEHCSCISSCSCAYIIFKQLVNVYFYLSQMSCCGLLKKCEWLDQFLLNFSMWLINGCYLIHISVMHGTTWVLFNLNFWKSNICNTPPCWQSKLPKTVVLKLWPVAAGNLEKPGRGATKSLQRACHTIHCIIELWPSSQQSCWWKLRPWSGFLK